MVVIKLKNPDTQEEKEFYIDGKLKQQLDRKVKPALTKKDEDYVLIIDGVERGGKSTFSQQVGVYIDPSLIGDLSRICFTPDEFRKAILNAKSGQCVIYDEAYRGLSAKGALTEVNRILVSLMMEMGQKNLFVIITLPTFYLLEKYVALWRARGLFHVYRRKGKKGFWAYFNNKKKRILYLKGKKDYSYHYVTSGFRGRFLGKYMVDDKQYRHKKAISLKKGYKTTRQEKYMEQRDNLIKIIYEYFGLTQEEIAELFKKYNIPLKRSGVRDILLKLNKKE